VGGLGSGRRRTRLGVDECRALELGELCDQGRWMRQPHGEVRWRSRRGGETLARLTYVIGGQGDATEDLLLTYRYECEGAGLSAAHEVEIDCAPGKRLHAYCPACGRRVRVLYAPPGAEHLACRSCYHLVYRRSQWREQLSYVQEVAGPALRHLQALAAAHSPPGAAPLRARAARGACP